MDNGYSLTNLVLEQGHASWRGSRTLLAQHVLMGNGRALMGKNNRYPMFDSTSLLGLVVVK